MRIEVTQHELKSDYETENRPLTVAFETLGCKLNQAETELLSRKLSDAGYCICSPKEPTDIYILNTCSVTHIADRKARHLIRMAHHRNPRARIIVLGCYVESAPDELTEIEGVDLVLGNEAKSDLPRLLKKYNTKTVKTPAADLPQMRTRSFIKAQDGCNNFCTYCIVPLVRGREKSQPPDEVINEVQSRVNSGYQEIVLTGTEIGRYNHDSLGFTDLLRRILSETGVKRLRLSSLQPQEITRDLIQLWQDPRLCRHFHISLQSGSDTVLKRMNRRYNTAEYSNKVDYLRNNIPEVAITTDVIVGFPGETDAEFHESYDFCKNIKFSRMHIFSYSSRKGTAAAQMNGQIPPAVKKQRSDKMLALAKLSLQNNHERFLGSSQVVLFEQNSNSLWSGYTDTYIKVYAKSNIDLTNRLVRVKLTGIHKDGVQGEVIE
jgi:threonylcarbamoyladenosine tRNA methylthiotransferase MtaB